MALSQIIKKPCPICGKIAVESSRIDFGTGYKVITLQCGHVITEDEIDTQETNYDIESLNKHYHPRQYQIDGIKFAEKSNVRCLIADEQGLGKTIQALGVLRLHPELLPALVVTKTTIKHQWFHELAEWCGMEKYLTQVISSSKEKALPGFSIYVTTYDMLKNDECFADINIKTIIIDECQAIKNHLSGRAKAVQKIAAKAEHIIALSGTPIKNHAGEYFTVLNILQPQRFPEYKRFIREHCDYYETLYGEKIGGLSNPEFFHEETKDFILRRTREEAAPELPRINRIFHHVELDKKLNTAYKDAMKELDNLLYAEEDENTWTSAIAIMTKMRKITGISKAAMEAVDYTMDFLASNERKITIFCHHHSATDLLIRNLNREIEKINKEVGSSLLDPVLHLHAGLSAERRTEVIRQFREERFRVLVASTLAAGEGINLQFCSDAIMLERQWNPANEEQAEGRFSRIGSTANQINVIYFIASETIDEYFTELVEQKRAIVSSTLDNKEIAWESNSLMKELAGVLLTKGKKRWSL
jgi:SNF2 family DNA or RNA helicase